MYVTSDKAQKITITLVPIAHLYLPNPMPFLHFQLCKRKVVCLSFSFKNSLSLSLSVIRTRLVGPIFQILFIYSIAGPKYEDPPKPAIPIPKKIHARKKNRNQIILSAIIPLIGVEFATYLLF